MFDLVIRNGNVVTPHDVFKGNIGVRGGKIAALSTEPLDGDEILDAEGKMVLPGLIDAHAHGGHGDPDRENFGTFSKACAAGGITTFVEMPLSTPSTLTPERLEDKKKQSGSASIVDYALYGGVVPGYLDMIEPMFREGACAFKCFTCRCSNYPMTDDGTLVEGMKIIGELGGLISVHAENDTLIQQLVDDFQAAGRNDARAFLDSHPVYSEYEAVARVFYLASLFPKCNVHIAHMSIPEGAELLASLRGRGQRNISAETCPQYLSLCEDDLIRIGPFAKCDPPVRTRESVEKLWKYVLDGTVDIIASDHSPHSFAKKTVAADGNFWPVSEGCTGVQTLLPVVTTEGLKRGIRWPQIARLCAQRPADLFGLEGVKGRIAPGYDADFAIVNPVEWVFKNSELLYLNAHSPYDGRTFFGKVERTILRGGTVYEKGRIVAASAGKFLRMRMGR